jgi:threonine dehydrogenase-like Zn-dependent dehydrogenase
MAGALTEYLVVPEAQLFRVPDSVVNENAVFTEPLAAALSISQQAVIETEDRLLVIGAGRLGQLIARTLALSGTFPVVVVRHERHETLLNRKGIATVKENEVKARAFDVVVEASGSASGMQLALHAIRPRGQVILKSTFPGTVAVNLSQLVVDEIRLTGSRCGPFGPALRLLKGGYMEPSELIDDIYPLTDGIAAMERAATPGSLKILVKP